MLAVGGGGLVGFIGRRGVVLIESQEQDNQYKVMPGRW